MLLRQEVKLADYLNAEKGSTLLYRLNSLTVSYVFFNLNLCAFNHLSKFSLYLFFIVVHCQTFFLQGKC